MLSLTTSRTRSRAVYVLAIGTVILLGLASRRYSSPFSEIFGKYPGDALWAAMVFFGWGALCPRASTATAACLAYAACIIVEVLKLYQAPWIVGLRHTTLGHLIFGDIFSVRNLIAYAVGVALAVGVEASWLRRWNSMAEGLGR